MKFNSSVKNRRFRGILMTIALALLAPGISHSKPAAFVPAPKTPGLNLPAAPSAGEIRAVRIFSEALEPVGEPSVAENTALAAALKTFFAARVAVSPSDASTVSLTPLETFLSTYPDSAWKASLCANLGIEYYARGRFTRALEAWSTAWKTGKDAPGKYLVIDRALGELARMYARLGMMEEIDALVAEAGDRLLTGAAREMFLGAREGLWQMRHEPEKSFKCGPFALSSILAQGNPAEAARTTVNQFPSTERGTSLAQLHALADSVGLKSRAVTRDRGTGIPLPAVIHWKLGHFGALLEKRGTRYLLQDPTFVTSQWIEEAVIDDESSGHFLILQANDAVLPDGCRPLSDAEAAEVWGKGDTGGGNGGGTGPGDNSSGGDGDDDSCPVDGLARWTVHLMLVSLNLHDTPLSYAPPRGPAIAFALNYDQREMNQPMTFGYGNLGPRWNLNWITTLTFDTNSATLHDGSGGSNIFPNFTSVSTLSDAEAMTSSRLEKVSPGVYQQNFGDGAVRVFGVNDGTRWFLTQVIDPQGNSVTLGYDAQYRLVAITDATGQVSTLTYNALQLTQITDPFGRTAQFHYDGSGRLDLITDAVGMTSGFAYGAGDQITTLTTGYGNTTFASSEVTAGANVLSRSLVATYPDGSLEKWETFYSASPVPSSEPPATVPAGMPVLNNFLQYRNTFHWDRKGMKEAPGDYTKAHIYHWNHDIGNPTLTGRLIESEKPPLESRIWYFYKGQQNAALPVAGTVNLATHIGRVLDDGSTQLWQYDYNNEGRIISATDPVGRAKLFVHAANGIDLLSISQPANGLVERLFTATYDGLHHPLTLAGADGQAIVYTYTTSGQVETLTDPLGEVTTFTYDGRGVLTSATGWFAGETAAATYTHDAVGRIATSTDALGYVLAFGYDGLNRLRSVTYPDGTQSLREYTLLDLSKLTDRRGRETSFTHDSLGHRISSTDPNGLTTRYDYCACGSLSRITDPMGRVTRWKFDVAGRKTAKIYADGSTETYGYDSAGRLTSATDPRGVTRLQQYGSDDTLSVISYTGGSVPTPSVHFKYDPFYARVTSIIDGSGATSLQYHPMESGSGSGMPARVLTPLGGIEYAYDEIGRVRMRSIGSNVETMTYDPLWRESAVTNALGTFQKSYLTGSRLPASIHLPNGQVTTFTYGSNLADRALEQILHFRADASPISKWIQAYDDEGQLTSWTQQVETDSPRNFTPVYDLADQLTGVTATNPPLNFTYAYDNAGNRVSELIGGVSAASTFNSLDELASIDLAASPVHSREFLWDGAGRLASIDYGGGDSTEFAYDAFDRCIRIVERAGGMITDTRQFLWDRDRRAEESNGEGAVTKRFFEGGVQILTGPSAGLYYYTRDHLGSIRELVDESEVVRTRYDYDPFGRRIKTEGDLETDFGYTGHFYHERSGLCLAPYRAYDPASGRWISRDPIGEADSVNLYAYVGNNPLSRIDPLGLYKVEVGGVGVAEIKVTTQGVDVKGGVNLGDVVIEGFKKAAGPCGKQEWDAWLAVGGLKFQKSLIELEITLLHMYNCVSAKKLESLYRDLDDLIRKITAAQKKMNDLYQQRNSSHPNCK